MTARPEKNTEGHGTVQIPPYEHLFIYFLPTEFLCTNDGVVQHEMYFIFLLGLLHFVSITCFCKGSSLVQKNTVGRRHG